MKGLLKGLRCISQVFDNEEEQEMQIGQPTDVKHVAHIGWDGPSATTPNWMNEFKGTSNDEVEDKPPTKSSNEEMQKSSDSPLDSPTRNNSSKTKPRRHKKLVGLDPQIRESTNKARRIQNANLGSQSPSQGPPGVVKESRRKKSKASSGVRSKLDLEPKPTTP